MPTDKPQIATRVSADVHAYYASSTQTLYQLANYVLEAWSVLERRTLAKLNLKGTEQALIREALYGRKLAPGNAGEHLLIAVEDGITLGLLNSAYEMEAKGRADFMTKLYDCSTAELAVLEVWAQR